MKIKLLLFMAGIVSLILLIGAAQIGSSQADSSPHTNQLDGRDFFGGAGDTVASAELIPVAYLPAILKIGCQDFYDDFSNRGSGWPTGATPNFLFDYVENEYQIKSVKSGLIFLLQSPACLRENYSAEVSGRWIGATGSSYGIIFVLKGDYDTFFIFDLNTDLGEYRVIRKIGDQQPDVPYHGSSPAILSGNAWNRLQVFVKGPWVTFRINNQVIRTEWFGSPTEGLAGTGITAAPYNDRPVAEARFDDFVTRQLTQEEVAGNWPETPATHDGVGAHVTEDWAGWPGIHFLWPGSE